MAVNLVEKIEAAFKQNKYVLGIYLNIADAFDGAWHPAIIKGLIDRQCPKLHISLINSFLSDRIVSLKLGMKTVSKYLTMSSLQGASLSPFLWNVDMDDNLTLQYDPSADTQGFADDSQLCIVK